MESQARKQLALLKAVRTHQLAAAALADLMDLLPEEKFAAMSERIQQNVEELHAEAGSPLPENLT